MAVGLLSVLMAQSGLIFAETKSTQLAGVTPATVTPPVVTPTTVSPAVVTPAVITPPVITPMTINPATTTPAVTTPAITTPTTITPTRVNPGPSSEATSTSTQIPTATTSDADTKKVQEQLPAGMIVKVDGTANLLKENKKVHHLKNKSLFFAHEIIYTKKDSKVAIRFNDGTLIVLGPESALQIQEYHFTTPAKGQNYNGDPKDRAEVKLFKGSLKAKLGSLVTANKPNAFVILTPRGSVTLSDPKKNADVEVIYNNKAGLAVKALGTLDNSKGQVIMTEKKYGTVSAVIGSSPILVETIPYVFSDAVFLSTASFFNAETAQINSSYSESIITEEESLMSTDAADTTGDINQSDDSDAASLSDDAGDDDGDEDEDDEDSDDSEDNDSDSDDEDNDDDSEDGSDDE